MPAYPDFEPIGAHTTATVGATVTTVQVPKRANAVLISSTANNAMVSMDGTTPTATVGIQIVADAAPLFIPLSHRASVLKMIREAGSDATVQYLFVRRNPRNWL